MSDYQPFITILTLMYKGKAYLAECIDGVLAQDYQNWVSAILDNSSDDQTRSVMDAYSAQEQAHADALGPVGLPLALSIGETRGSA